MSKDRIDEPGNRAGAELALLLLSGFRALIDETTTELAKLGFHDIRASHEFAMRAIVNGADSAVDLARQLSVTKQAAAKTITALEDRGLVTREADAGDGRRKRLILTERGEQMLKAGGDILDAARARWCARIGSDAVIRIHESLRTLVGSNTGALDTVEWLAGTTE